MLRAVAHLPRRELDSFIRQVLSLRAKQDAASLNIQESELLLQINASWAAPLQQRHDELVAKREAETISAPELLELIALTQQAEQRNVERLQALIALAAIRNTTVPALMDVLGLPKPAHA